MLMPRYIYNRPPSPERRQREEECSGGDLHGSEEEVVDTGEDGCNAKRSKDDRDPLDSIRVTPYSRMLSAHMFTLL